MTETTIYDCNIKLQPHKLARRSQTAAEIEQTLTELAQYENCTGGFDCIDPQGDVAQVYLFVRNGKLWVRGRRHNSGAYRDPRNVWKFLQQSMRVKDITLAVKQ